MATYWHMQIHRNDVDAPEAKEVWSILEHKKIIGLGKWEEGKEKIRAFKEDMKVNDIVAIKTGANLIALVQVIGGAYEVDNDGWIHYRRPIRVLDWATNDECIEQPRGTLNICKDPNAPTTKTITNWHHRVCEIMKKREVPLTV